MPMIRTGQQYRDSIRDGRQVWINGERVKDGQLYRSADAGHPLL
jgi:aromatic ring hydroxylase